MPDSSDPASRGPVRAGRSGAPRVPWDLRLVAVLCTIVSVLVGLGASSGAMQAMQPRAGIEHGSPMGGPAVDAAFTHLVEVQAQALEPMRASRALILFTLSICTGITLIGGIRLVRPGGLPREGIRRLTAATALVAAVLRTLDGAQELALTRRTASAAFEYGMLVSQSLFQSLAMKAESGDQQAWTTVMLGMSVLLTAAVAGSFLALWHYLGTQRVKDAVAQDA